MMLRRILFIALAPALLAGCLFRQSAETRFYYLSTPAPAQSAPVDPGKVFLVGLRITTADYLRTKQMIVESGPNQLRLSEENVWQETPQAGFARILAQRFARNLPDCQLTPMPLAMTNKPEFVLEIELLSLQGRLHPRSEAEISAEVRLLNPSAHLVSREDLRKTSPWTPSALPVGYPALAAAESQVAAALADEIGRKVLARHRKIQDAGK